MRGAFFIALINTVFTNNQNNIFISKDDLWNMFESTVFEEIIGHIDQLIAQDYVIYLQNQQLFYENYTNVITADIATIIEYEEKLGNFYARIPQRYCTPVEMSCG